MRRKYLGWTEGQTDGRTDRGKTVYSPPPSGSGGIIINTGNPLYFSWIWELTFVTAIPYCHLYDFLPPIHHNHLQITLYLLCWSGLEHHNPKLLYIFCLIFHLFIYFTLMWLFCSPWVPSIGKCLFFVYLKSLKFALFSNSSN